MNCRSPGPSSNCEGPQNGETGRGWGASSHSAPRADHEVVLLTISEPPWGFWATIGFSLIIYISVMLLQIVATVALLAAAQIHSPRPDLLAVVERMDAQGLYLSLIICCINTPVFIALSAVVASMRRDVPVKEYLGFCPVAVRKIVLWCGVLALFIAGCDTITFLAKGPVVPDFMIRAYKSAYFPPLLWFASSRPVGWP